MPPPAPSTDSVAVFAWIFTSWALLAVTPLYVFMVRGLENAGFVQDELDEIARLQAALPPPAPAASSISSQAAVQGTEVKQHAV